MGRKRVALARLKAPALFRGRPALPRANAVIPASDAGTMEGAFGSAERRHIATLGTWLRNPAVICLAAAVAASGAILVTLGSHLIFYWDAWNMVLERSGLSAGVFLDPHHQHLLVAVVVIYKLLLATFGMSSPLPFHAASTLIYLLAAVLLFVYARRRVGDWLALLGTALILFFGVASYDLLLPFQMFFSGAIAAGIGALLALDHDDRRGDVVACGLLVVSTSFSEVGIAFTVGAVVHMALARRPFARRSYVALLPLVLYGLWWLGWGHTGHSYLSLQNVVATPAYVFDAVATAMGALLAIISSGNHAPATVDQRWAQFLPIVAVGLAAWRVRRLGGVPRGVWPVLAVGLTFWVLAGFNQDASRGPDNSRYLYPSAVFILLIASGLLRGLRLSNRAMVAATAATAIAVTANLVFLSDDYRLYWTPKSQESQAELRALEIAGRVNPAYVLTTRTAGLIHIGVGSYLSAVDAWGSPAYTASELRASPESQRLKADRVLATILGLKLAPVGSAAAPCRTVRASPSGVTGLKLAPGRVTIGASGSTKVKVLLGRFSDQLPVDAGSLGRRSRASLTIPTDRSTHPWRLGLKGDGPVKLCGAGLT